MRIAVASASLVGVAAALVALSAGAAADTPITNSSTSQLFVLEVAGSPYLLDHDFHVQPGGFLFISEGVELRMDNGSKLVGDGGSISATGTDALPAVIGPRPLSAFLTWGGIELQNGSTLTLRHARVVSADRAITFLGIATLDAQFSEFAGCGEWCVNTTTGGTLILRDSKLSDGVWGIVERGSVTPLADNVSLSNFSGGGVSFAPGSAGALFTGISAAVVGLGILADGLTGSALGGLSIDTAGAAIRLNGTVDVTVHNSTMRSPGSIAVDDRSSIRLTLRDNTLEGADRAVSLVQSSATALLSNRLASSNGSCLYLLNATNALLRGNRLEGCLRPLSVDASSAPPTADADASNSVEGRPFLWISNAAGVEVGAADNPGLVVLSAVAGATLSDLRLRGAGIHIFGSSDVRVERVLVEDAEVGLTAIGTRGLTVHSFVARNVSMGIRVWSSGFFAAAQDIVLDGLRIDGAQGDGIQITDAANVTLTHAYSRAGGAAVNFTRVQTAFVRLVFVENSTVGLLLNGTTGATVVDSLFAGSSAFGLLAPASAGYAARNAFVDNAEHASSPGSPGFAFSELGGGNFWSGFTAANADGDAFFDTPYNLTDGTGADLRPRVSRLDFGPTVIVLPPGVLEVGASAFIDAGLSFDDFAVATIYWTIVLPGQNLTGSGPAFPWTPNNTGTFTVTAEAQDSWGAAAGYTFRVTVRDTTAPTLGPIVHTRPEVGTNMTVTLPNATDNDAAFPVGLLVIWSMSEPLGVTRTGNSTSLAFEVPITRVGDYDLTVRLIDPSGNAAQGTVSFKASDTTPPEVEFLTSGAPDLGVPFMIDASQAGDPVGVDPGSARWSWTDEAQVHTAAGWPTVSITFNDSGIHVVTLTLCDTAGNCGDYALNLDARDRTGPKLTSLRVVAPGSAAVEVHPETNPIVTVKLNDEVVFEIVGADRSAPVVYSWNFGDGSRAEGARVTHRFTNLGMLSVSVSMTDAAGNSNTTAVRVNVEGGGILEIIPGGPLGLVLLVAALAGGGVGLFLMLRWRAKNRKNY